MTTARPSLQSKPVRIVIGLVLATPAIVGISMVVSVLTTPPRYVPFQQFCLEGTVAGAPIASPTGAPFAFAHVELGVRHRVKNGWGSRTLLREVRGGPAVTIDTSTGPRQLVLDRPLDQLEDFTFETAVVQDLTPFPEAQQVPNWRELGGEGGFVYQVLALHPAQRVLIERDDGGRFVALWNGTYDDLLARRKTATEQGRSFAVFGIYLTLGSLFASLMTFRKVLAARYRR